MLLVVGIGIRETEIGNYFCVIMLLKGITWMCSSGLSRRDSEGTARTCAIVTASGNLEMLQWARASLKGWGAYGSDYVGASERLLVASQFDSVSICR